MRVTLVLVLLLGGQGLYAQKSLNQLVGNKNFDWQTESSSDALRIYYQNNSWAAENIQEVYRHVLSRIADTKDFMGIDTYPHRLHLFIVSNRAEMAMLINRQTNGAAFPKENIITGIASPKINAIYSNHELFHVMAMNLWGIPEKWLNEGMAVYADKFWHNYPLDVLAKYLIDQGRYIPLTTMIRKFNKTDTTVSYPLLGSFVKFLDETYGREKITALWQGKIRDIPKIMGKDIRQLEEAWLNRLNEVNYDQINY